MNKEFFEALNLLSTERGIPKDDLMNKIRVAINIAVKKNYGVEDENIRIIMEPETGKFGVALLKEVLEDGEVIENANLQISLSDALLVTKRAKVNTMLPVPLKTKEFGRIGAQAAKHAVHQSLREAERSQMYAEMQSSAHEIVSAVVMRVDKRKGIVTLDMGKNEAYLMPNEQVKGEEYNDGDRIKVYVVDVNTTERGPRIMISRTHPGLVKRMFEMEVPEIHDGTVEIKAISREAGIRTKIAVYSKDENVDPIGSCIGPRGTRVANIVEELNGEKIDIVKYSDDITEFISAALSPANVVKVEILEGEAKSCRVTVPDHQLSLAIGNKGQNARLTARLTGYNIDIRPESGYFGEDASELAPVKKVAIDE